MPPISWLPPNACSRSPLTCEKEEGKAARGFVTRKRNSSERGLGMPVEFMNEEAFTTWEIEINLCHWKGVLLCVGEGCWPMVDLLVS